MCIPQLYIFLLQFANFERTHVMCLQHSLSKVLSLVATKESSYFKYSYLIESLKIKFSFLQNSNRFKIMFKIVKQRMRMEMGNQLNFLSIMCLNIFFRIEIGIKFSLLNFTLIKILILFLYMILLFTFVSIIFSFSFHIPMHPKTR